MGSKGMTQGVGRKWRLDAGFEGIFFNQLPKCLPAHASTQTGDKQMRVLAPLQKLWPGFLGIVHEVMQGMLAQRNEPIYATFARMDMHTDGSKITMMIVQCFQITNKQAGGIQCLKHSSITHSEVRDDRM